MGMKSLLAISAVLCIGLAACGHSTTEKSGASDASIAPATNTTTATTSTSAVSARPSLRNLKGDEDDDETGENLGNSSKDNDADFDNDYKPSPGYYDPDDGAVRNWGHAAPPALDKTLTGIVQRYFAAAAAGNGKGACALITPVFVHAIPEDYGQAPGPVYLRGKTCAAVMTKLFKHAHRELAGGTVVTGVRVGGGEALVLIGSPTMIARYVALRRSHGSWRVNGLLGAQMP
jgi:hypothetical protein